MRNTTLKAKDCDFKSSLGTNLIMNVNILVYPDHLNMLVLSSPKYITKLKYSHKDLLDDKKYVSIPSGAWDT